MREENNEYKKVPFWKQLKMNSSNIETLINEKEITKNTLKRFDDQNDKINGLLEREEWVRGRFEEQDHKINGLLEREEWVRGRFEEQDHKINGLLEREEWVRERFDKFQNEIDSLKRELLIPFENRNIAIQESFYNKRTYSQSGEDAIISYALNFLNKDLTNISYLDLGANHAIEMSNTYAYYQNGCKGVLIEANPELIPELQKYRQNDIILNKALTFDDTTEVVDFYVLSGDGLSTIDYEEAMNACKVNPNLSIKKVYQIETISVNEILNTYFKEEGPTILSIDLEGIEEKILEEYDFEKFRPVIIVLENIPYKPYLVIEDREDKAGSLLRKLNYTEYAFTGINSIYIDKQYVNEFNNKLINRQTKGE